MKLLHSLQNLFLLIILLFSFCAGYSKNYIGIKSGLGFNNEITNYVDYYGKLGYDFTTYYCIPTKKHHDLKFKISYKNRGNKAPIFYDYQLNIKSRYLIQKYYFLALGPEIIFPRNNIKNKLYFLTGFDIMYLIKYVKNFDDMLGEQTFYRKIQYELNGGLGYNINSNLFIEIVNYFSLINKLKSKEVNGKLRRYGYYLGLSLGYNFKTNKICTANYAQHGIKTRRALVVP